MSELFDITCSQKSNITEKFRTRNPIFVCVISYTETSQVPGITFAGANPDLIKYTPAADSEFLYHGKCFSIPGVPATPDGIPTPALLTRTALLMGKIPCLVVDSGSKIKPKIPHISFGITHGRNIQYEPALELFETHQAFEYGKLLGQQLSMSNDLIVVGESIPGGTTTGLGVLTGLGIDANYKMSSSMPINPHDLKIHVVKQAIKNQKIHRFARSVQNSIFIRRPDDTGSSWNCNRCYAIWFQVDACWGNTDGCSPCVHALHEVVIKEHLLGNNFICH